MVWVPPDTYNSNVCSVMSSFPQKTAENSTLVRVVDQASQLLLIRGRPCAHRCCHGLERVMAGRDAKARGDASNG